MTQHSKFAPSKLAQIIACPGCVKMTEMAPPAPPSSYAEEGTMLHEIMQKIMLIRDPNFYMIENPEHRTICKAAYEYVSSYIYDEAKSYEIFLEQKVTIPGTNIFGIADVIAYSHYLNTLQIFDYKFGGGVRVDLENNPQFMAYALGAAEMFMYEYTLQKAPTIMVHVVQPRLDNQYWIKLLYHDLVDWRSNVLLPTIHLAKTDDPPLNASEKTCRWCGAKAACPAYYDFVNANAQEVFTLYKEVIEEASTGNKRLSLSQEALLKFYKARDVLKMQIKAVEDYILAELLRGRKVPGYKVVYGRANRKWKDENGVVNYLSEMYDADYEDMYETKLKSPAQLEKIYPGCRKDNKFRQFIETPQGAPKVVEESAEDESPNPFSSVMD